VIVDIECDSVDTNQANIVCDSVECNIVVELPLPVHTVPTLADILPTLSPGEVAELATLFSQDLTDGLREQKVILGILDLLRAKGHPLPADVDKYNQLKERAYVKTRHLDLIQSQFDLIIHWVNHHIQH
jgi:hypothetical protein